MDKEKLNKELALLKDDIALLMFSLVQLALKIDIDLENSHFTLEGKRTTCAELLEKIMTRFNEIEEL